MKEIIKQIVEVSDDLRHAISVHKTERIEPLQNQLFTLVEALKVLSK